METFIRFAYTFIMTFFSWMRNLTAVGDDDVFALLFLKAPPCEIVGLWALLGQWLRQSESEGGAVWHLLASMVAGLGGGAQRGLGYVFVVMDAHRMVVVSGIYDGWV